MFPPGFNTRLISALLDWLWRSWIAFGVAGQGPAAREDRVIDPEALILAGSQWARYDARLFDEMLDWLCLHGDLVHLQRLRNLHRSGLGNARVLSAIAAVVANHSPHAKWKVLVTNAESDQPLTPLFLSMEKNDTAWGQPEPLFAAQGLHRGRLELRHLSLPPNPRLAANFWLKLRSLFGTSSRAEIMLHLLVSGPATATEIARASGFTTRSILVPLREMALSGHLYEPPRPARTRPLRGQPAVARTRGPSQDYALRQAEWEFLRTWEEPSGFPRLESPVPLLRLCRVALDLDASASGDSSMLQGLRLREAAAGPLAEIHRLGLSGSYGLPTDLSGDRLAATLSECLPALIADL